MKNKKTKEADMQVQDGAFENAAIVMGCIFLTPILIILAIIFN